MADRQRTTWHHGDLRNVLITEGMKSLESTGYEALSMRDLARRSGVSKNAPYQHFADKSALLAAIAAEGFRILADDLEAVVDKGGNILAAMGLIYLNFARDHPRLYGLMFSRLGYSLDAEDCRIQGQRALDALQTGMARHLRHSGTFDPTRLRDELLLSWGLVHGLASLFAEGLIPPDLERGADIARLLELNASRVAGNEISSHGIILD